MEKKPWLFKFIHSILVASLFLSVPQINIFAASDSIDPSFNDFKQVSTTSTPTPTTIPENENICGLTSEDCGDLGSTETHSTEMNFEAHPNADVVIILFWMEDCAHCAQVLNKVLPKMVRQYNEQIFIYPIELKEIKSVDTFYKMAERLGVPKNNIGVPLAIVGNQVLTGDQIESELSNWVEKNLQAGNKTILAIPEFEDQLPESIQNRQMKSQNLSNGNTATNQNNNSRTITLILAVGLPVLIVVLLLRYFYFKRTNQSKA